MSLRPTSTPLPCSSRRARARASAAMRSFWKTRGVMCSPSRPSCARRPAIIGKTSTGSGARRQTIVSNTSSDSVVTSGPFSRLSARVSRASVVRAVACTGGANVAALFSRSPSAMGFAMADDVLIYSLSEHRDLIFALFSAAQPTRVVEIGSEAGGMTREMCRWASDSAGRSFTAVEPFPVAEVRSLAASVEAFTLVEGRSPEALASVPPADAYLIDGDHNYWTVSRELEAVYADERAPLAVLHDVGWPCARRDQYYSVEALPSEAVHPHSYSRGRAPGVSELVDRGFGGGGSFAVACSEGGPRNGVLTAVEDFLSSRPELSYAHVPAVFGLGVIWSSAAPYAAAVARLLAPWDRNPLLERLEENRLRLYMRVLELQDRLGRADPASNQVLLRYAERLADLEAENASLRLERGHLRAAVDAAPSG